MGVLGEVLGAHRVRPMTIEQERDHPYRVQCMCGEQCYLFDEHVERALLARLADALGSDETREVVAEAIDLGVEDPCPCPECIGGQADLALAAVREVLGLPEGRAKGSVSDERAESEPLGVERVVEDVDGEWEK